MKINKIYCGHVLDILKPFPAESIDCVITSPPYWALRDYGIPPVIWADGWKGNLGLEPSLQLYITHLTDIFDAIKRVLKKTGTIFVNLGDAHGSGKRKRTDDNPKKIIQRERNVIKGMEKCLLMIPERFAIEMINRGWVLRNIIIWHKPNSMPSSARRFTIDYEFIFWFSKNIKPLYWVNYKIGNATWKKPLGIKGNENIDWEWKECNKCNGTGFLLEEEKIILRTKKIKEGCKKCKGTGKRQKTLWQSRDIYFEQQFEKSLCEGIIWSRRSKKGGIQEKNNPHANWGYTRGEGKKVLGRNKRCVWSIPTQAFPEAHFATYPEKLVEECIKPGCPRFVCESCGLPREKILEPTKEYSKFLGQSWHDHKNDKTMGFGQQTRGYSKRKGDIKGIKRYNNRGYTNYIGIEINPDYIKMAEKRISPYKNKTLDKWLK